MNRKIGYIILFFLITNLGCIETIITESKTVKLPEPSSLNLVISK